MVTPGTLEGQPDFNTQHALYSTVRFLSLQVSDLEIREIGKVIKIDEGRIEKHLDEIVRSTVEETFNRLLDAEADRISGVKRYERSPDRKDTRAGQVKAVDMFRVAGL